MHRHLGWTLAALAAAAACDGGGGTQDGGTEDDGGLEVEADGGDGASEDGGGEDALEEAEGSDDGGDDGEIRPGWQPPVEWRRPIDDYIADVRETLDLELEEFDHGVKDLAVFEDRLYLGYGDWTQNTGRAVGLQVRSFADPEAEVEREFTVEEESIDAYRLFDRTLWIAGVDAAEDALIGNVYRKPEGGSWRKERDLAENLHVLDLLGHAGAIFASGGGCDDMDHYYANDDQGVLYRSDDGGDTWAIDLEWHDDDPAAVVRFDHFAAVEGNLYVFGNTINGSTGTLRNVPRRWDDGAWTEVSLLPSTWVLRSWQFDPTTAVVLGVDLSARRFRAWRVLAGESTRVLARFDTLGQRPVDFFPRADGGMLVLTRDGHAYPDEAAPPYGWHVWATDDLFAATELLGFASDRVCLAVAEWEGSLYLGTADGAILRSVSLP